MAVRQFDGLDDDITCSVGALSGWTHGTIGIIFKRSVINAFSQICTLNDATPDTVSNVFVNNGDGAANAVALGSPFFSNSHGPAVEDTTAWRLLVVRKATGFAIPRFSLYNFSTLTWAHGSGEVGLDNCPAPGADGSVRFSLPAFGIYLHALIGVRGMWSNEVKWSADASGDTAIESAGLHTSLQAWVDATPSALWRYDQTDVTTSVLDLTGGGADQTARTGTTVVTGDDPPGFSFATSGGGVTGSGSAQVGAGQATGVGAVAVTGSGTAGIQASASGTGAVTVSGAGSVSPGAGVASGAAEAIAAASGLAGSTLPGAAVLVGEGQVSIAAAGALTAAAAVASTVPAESDPIPPLVSGPFSDPAVLVGVS